jgi:cystathionine gamma-lyase
MQFSTRVVHAGVPRPEQGAAFMPGPQFAGTYHLAGDKTSASYQYGRFHNPTWSLYEAALGELEGGQTLVFPSGLAAVAALLGTVLGRPYGGAPGVVVMPNDGYYAARAMAETVFAQYGAEVRSGPTAGEGQRALLSGARLLWIETPSNPRLDVADIAALSAEAHRHGALVVVDNTTATPLGQAPLELGADFVLASDTKATTGHSDLVLGHVTARDPVWAERLHAWRTQTGAIAGPMEVWLAHRSLATLDVRLERQCANALAIARFLKTHPAVQAVRYPGLEEDPSHALARRQMRRFGMIVSFTLADQAAAEQALSRLRLIWQATSFGGVHTMAERRARWGSDDVPPGFIRLSAGLEAAEDLIADLQGAL